MAPARANAGLAPAPLFLAPPPRPPLMSCCSLLEQQRGGRLESPCWQLCVRGPRWRSGPRTRGSWAWAATRWSTRSVRRLPHQPPNRASRRPQGSARQAARLRLKHELHAHTFCQLLGRVGRGDAHGPRRAPRLPLAQRFPTGLPRPRAAVCLSLFVALAQLRLRSGRRSAMSSCRSARSTRSTLA